MSLTFTLDLEDHRPDETAELRFPVITERLLDDLDEWGATGTVFAVGEVVRDHPDLVKRIAARGHEIGLHGARHTPLPEVGPDRFAAETAEATDRLAQLIGCPVRGFRAPIFSLVPASKWAPAVLTDLGYSYSSSVLPAANPLFGWPGAPTRPFRWPCGLVELPAPVHGVGSVRLPLFGGTYLRLTPAVVARLLAQRAPKHAWLYAHPYDFDVDEERWVVPEVGALGSRTLWGGRSGMRNKVASLVSGADRPLAIIAEQVADETVQFDPETT